MQNQNSGGWRYGNGGSSQFLYRNEEVDNDLLRRAAEVAAPKGLLDAKIEAAPIDKYLQQSNDSGSGGDGYGGNQGPQSNSYSGFATPNDGDTPLGTTATGMSNSVAGKLGSMAAGLLGLPSPVGYAAGIGLNGLIGSQPATMPSGMYAAMMQMDAQARENDSQGGYGGFSSADMSAAMSQMDAQAAENEANNSYGGGGNDGGGGGGTNSDGGTGDTGSDGNGGGGTGDSDSSDNGMYKGGYVKKGLLAGPNPKGPDDGYAALDHGEYVIKASAVKKYGKGLLDAINTEKYKG